MQASLVLMIFLRLVEDVMTLQTVPTQRRRDILTALTTVMPSLFPCFVQTLRINLELCHAKVKCLLILTTYSVNLSHFSCVAFFVLVCRIIYGMCGCKFFFPASLLDVGSRGGDIDSGSSSSSSRDSEYIVQ